MEKFEEAFEALETSKVNVGKVRREWAREFIANIEDLIDKDQDTYDGRFIELTMAE